MKYLIVILTFFFYFLPQSNSVYAHPGRTDSSGGHTCKTNCEGWGLNYGEYHYHNGGYVAPVQTTVPTKVPTSTPKPTAKSTPTPTKTPTFTPTTFPTPTPTSDPEVKGESTQTSPSPVIADTQTEGASTSDTLIGLGVMATMGGGALWLGRGIWRKLRK